MGYYKSEVEAARSKIAAAVPEAVFETNDFGFRLSAYIPGAKHYYVVFQPFRPDIQHEIIGDVAMIIQRLKDDATRYPVRGAD